AGRLGLLARGDLALERLPHVLGPVALADLPDDRHPARDPALRVPDGEVASLEDALATGLRDTVRPFAVDDDVAGEDAPEDVVLARLAEERKDLERDPPDNLVRRHAGDALHPPAPHRVAVLEVEAQDPVEAAVEEAAEPRLRVAGEHAEKTG